MGINIFAAGEHKDYAYEAIKKALELNLK